jgi:hypothetical protein
MNGDPNWLIGYARNVHSQFGEDGVLEKVFSLMPSRPRWCVEFGAWDGVRLSNTRFLIHEGGWSAVLIEADAARFQELRANYTQRGDVVCLNKYIGFKAPNTLDDALAQTPIPRDFDLLSIDIDGNDYHVFKSIQRYRPKVVVIEFNNTIPNSIEFVQPADPTVNQGSSLLSLYKLAKKKLYELICVTDFNAIFVDEPYFSRFEITDNAPTAINHDQKYLTHVFQLFDGTLVWRGNTRLLWHGVDIDPEKMQVLSKEERVYPPGAPLAQPQQLLGKVPNFVRRLRRLRGSE